MLLKVGPLFHSRPEYIFSQWRTLSFGINFCLLDRVFSELFGTNFHPVFLKGVEVGWNICIFIYLTDAGQGLVKAEFTHYRVGWGPFESIVSTHCSCCWGPLWRQSTWLWCGTKNITRIDNKFFTEDEENLRAKHLEEVPNKGGPWQVRRSPSHKHTTGHTVNSSQRSDLCRLYFG